MLNLMQTPAVVIHSLQNKHHAERHYVLKCGLESGLNTGVAIFQGSWLEGFHCTSNLACILICYEAMAYLKQSTWYRVSIP